MPKQRKPKVKVNEERKVACLSTAHMKPKDAQILNTGVVVPGLIMSGEYGYQFYDPVGEGLRKWKMSGLSPELYAAIRTVLGLGYDRVEFDADAEKADGLPIFEWD